MWDLVRIPREASPQTDENRVGRIALAPSDTPSSNGGLSDSVSPGPTYFENRISKNQISMD